MLQFLGSIGQFMGQIWLPWVIFWGAIIAFNLYLGYKEKNRKPGANGKALATTKKK